MHMQVHQSDVCLHIHHWQMHNHIGALWFMPQSAACLKYFTHPHVTLQGTCQKLFWRVLSFLPWHCCPITTWDPASQRRFIKSITWCVNHRKPESLVNVLSKSCTPSVITHIWGAAGFSIHSCHQARRPRRHKALAQNNRGNPRYIQATQVEPSGAQKSRVTHVHKHRSLLLTWRSSCSLTCYITKERWSNMSSWTLVICAPTK